MASSASDKQSAATYMEQHLLPDTAAAGRLADGGGVPFVGPRAPSALLKPDTGLKGLSGWAMDKGLSEAMTTWQGQVGRLMGVLNGELGALRSTNSLFQGQDRAFGTQLNAVRPGQGPYRSRLDDM
ncbi:hypothetical protein ACIHFE_18780 [Streptomyces sp. NPDC052396]|uniref:hypothetical protein n=1 Tax=Streptomyces sp. NPDC052396 TaxID=3365689 RepID=UPI0037D4197F